MPILNEEQVKEYMRDNVELFIDEETGEVNCTLLAEDTAKELDLYIDAAWTIPEEVYDWAVDISQESARDSWLNEAEERRQEIE